MRSRLAAIATLASLFIFFWYVLLPHDQSASSSSGSGSKSSKKAIFNSQSQSDASNLHVAPELLHGASIMPHLGNETAKAELGRASWKLLHTMLARYPKSPTADERSALGSYLHLFARLYPCGECSEHFRVLLADNPPQTSSRDAASQWGCYVHNLVNERLKKPAFDCGRVTEEYKCGCADADEGDEKLGEAQGSGSTRGPKPDPLEENIRGKKIDIEREGITRGG